MLKNILYEIHLFIEGVYRSEELDKKNSNNLLEFLISTKSKLT